jgi:hypothetical protein
MREGDEMMTPEEIEARRCDLINKDICGELDENELAELKQLTILSDREFQERNPNALIELEKLIDNLKVQGKWIETN